MFLRALEYNVVYFLFSLLATKLKIIVPKCIFGMFLDLSCAIIKRTLFLLVLN